MSEPKQHAEAWIAEHGRFRRAIYASELRTKLGRVKGECTWCGGVLKGRRTSWCSQACVNSFMERTPGTASRLVAKRDKGVCAICGRDTERMSDLWHKIRRMARDCQTWYAALDILVAHWRSVGFSTSRWSHGHLWEADHIIPVAEGGGCCPISNLRTACLPCHKAETKRLAARLASKRKSPANVATIQADLFGNE